MESATRPFDGLRGDDKFGIRLTTDDMWRLVAFLSEEFGITFPGNGVDVEDEIWGRLPEHVAREYSALNERRRASQGKVPSSLDDDFYALIASQPLMGMVHSTKYPYILDAAAYLTALSRRFFTKSPKALDIGCGPGYHAIWLARETGATVVGIDRCAEGIKYAENKGNQLKVSATFRSETFPALPSETFNLAYSCDGPASLSAPSFKVAARALAHDGIFVWIGGLGNVSVFDVKRALSEAGLSLLLADVVGGWNGWDYAANTVLVMRKGPNSNVEKSFKLESEHVWRAGFAAYCNNPSTPPNQKSLGWFRALRTST